VNSSRHIEAIRSGVEGRRRCDFIGIVASPSHLDESDERNDGRSSCTPGSSQGAPRMP